MGMEPELRVMRSDIPQYEIKRITNVPMHMDKTSGKSREKNQEFFLTKCILNTKQEIC